MHSCYIGERNHTLHHDTHNHQPFLFSVIISNTTSYSLQIFLFHTFYWHSMSDNHHAGKQISMHQQHHPSACNNRGLVNQHEEDTIEASLEEENGDHEVRRIKDSPRTITGAEDPYFTEGIKNPGWLSTAALFLTTFSIFGITFCWGVFQPHYLNHVYPGQTDVFRIAFIGTSAQAITTLLGLPLTWVIRWIGYKGTMMIGMVLLPLGLILASFATQLWQTALTHGVLVGIGAAFCFSSSFMLPSQWFIRRRATVNGIGNAGACVGALCLSPLAQHLIETVGYRNALRVLGCIVFALLSLAALISRARYPPSHSSTTSTTPTTLMEKKRCRVSLFRSSPFVSAPFAFALVFSLLTPFGYVAPFYLMPTYVMQVVGSSASMGAAFVSVGMATGIVSRLGFGFIGDRIGPINALFLATLISGKYKVMWMMMMHSC